MERVSMQSQDLSEEGSAIYTKDIQFSDAVISTPTLTLSTSHGSLNFSNKYLADEIKGNFLTQLEIGDLVKKPFGSMALENLYDSPDGEVKILSPRPMGSAPPPANAKGISVSGCNGRHVVTVTEYFARIQIEKPSVVIAMADEVDWHKSSKRLRAAVERSLKWFTELKSLLDEDVNEGTSPMLYGVVVGGQSCGLDLIERQILTYLQGGVRGIVVGGVGQGESLDERRDFLKIIGAIVQHRVPLLVQGVDSLTEIMHSVYFGVDIICSDFPRVVSSVGLVLNCDVFDTLQSDCEENSAPLKRQKREIQNLQDISMLNLWDTKFRNDKSAIISNCQCHCCRLYTRAYLHHLLLSHELLAEAMIFVHNRHVTIKMLEATKYHLRCGDFVPWVQDFLSKNSAL